MSMTGYVDLSRLNVETEQDDRELMDFFQGQQVGSRMVLVLDGEALRLIPKIDMFAAIRAGQMVREQRERDEAREQRRRERTQQASQQRRTVGQARRRKRREERAKGAAAAATIAALGLGAYLMANHIGNSTAIFEGMCGLVLLQTLWAARKAVRR